MTDTKLRSVERLEVIILVDNSIDWSSANEQRNIFSPRQWAETKEHVILYLQGGHGFSVLLRAKNGTETKTILYDAGPQESIISNNVEALGIDMSEIDAVVMSHGHYDHFGGLEWSLKKNGKSGIPVHVHPRMFLPKAVMRNGKRLNLPDIIGEVTILESGATIVAEKGPSLILDDTFLISGEIPRETEWEKGMKGHMAYAGGKWQDDQEIIDDRCIVANVKGRGLVIVSGCSHAGIVNMIQHCIKLTSEKKVEAVIGGLHLANASDSAIEATTRSIKEINPKMIVPTHCTGWKAQTHMQRILKQSFARSSVGNMYVFGM